MLAILLSGVVAEGVTATVPVEVIASAGHCDRDPDRFVDAPEAGGGRSEHNFSGVDDVLPGDRSAAQRGLCVAVRVRLAGFGPGRKVTVRIEPPDGDAGWRDMKIGPDARLEFGRLPAIGEALPKGRYLLSVLTGGKSLFTCRIVLHGGVDLGLCLPEAS